MSRLLYGLVTLGLFSVTVQAEADYIFTTLDVYSAQGINDSGEIVGYYRAGGFLYSGGSYTTINVSSPREFATFPSGINNSGQIVGWYANDVVQHGFLLSGGRFTQLDPPGSMGTTFAFGINDAGSIVGTSNAGGFLFSGGSYTTVGPPVTFAAGINNAGQITGSFYDTIGRHGFLMSDGSFTKFDVPGSHDTAAWGINGSGQIVGGYDGRYGFLLSDGIYTTIDVPGSVFTIAFGINDVGDIVGEYQDADGTPHGFLATPTPEPPALLAIGVAALCLITWAWQRSKRAETRQ